MKTSKFIRRAKRFLWDGKGPEPPTKSRYVCICLLAAHHRHLHSEAAFRRAGGHVNTLLGREHGALESWLAQRLRISECRVLADMPRLQATRLAWMEDMAQWFEAQED